MTREVKKPRESLTTIGVLLDLPYQVEGAGQRLVAGALALDDLDQRHLVDRREEVQPDEVGLAARRPRRAAVMGSVEVLEHSSASGATTSWISWNTLCLSAGSSKTASMTASQPGEVGGVGGRGDAGEQRVAPSPRWCGPRRRALAQQLRGVRLALLRRPRRMTSLSTTSMPARAQE